MARARQKELREQLRALIPLCPLGDAALILDKAQQLNKKGTPPSIALWLVVGAIIRHQHTDYDALLAQGYDAAAARHFTTDAMNDILRRWGCVRRV